MHLPTYAFARMRCWIPSKEDVRAGSGADRGAGVPSAVRGDNALRHLDTIEALFAELEQDRMSAEEVTARVRQLA